MSKKQHKNPPSKKQGELELIYGVHPLIELLHAKSRKLITLYTTKPTPKSFNQVQRLLPDYTQIQYVTKETLTKMAHTQDHQGIVGLATPRTYRKQCFTSDKSPFVMLLDSIHDPRNLGAIMRSAYCTGVDGIIICGKNSAPLNATAIKASAGLAEHMPIYKAASAKQALQELSQHGYNIYLATINGKDARTVPYIAPLCLVIGNEATGISQPLLPFGIQVRLAQRTADISYNASVAAGILLFMIGDQIDALKHT